MARLSTGKKLGTIRGVDRVVCVKPKHKGLPWVCTLTGTNPYTRKRRRVSGTGKTIDTAFKMALLALRDRASYPEKP